MIKIICSQCKRWAKYDQALNIHFCPGCGREITDEMIFDTLCLPKAMSN